MATVPVVRMVSLISLRSTTPNFTPMDCRRSGESWMGERGVSADGGGVEGVLVSCLDAVVEAGATAEFVAVAGCECHQKPARAAIRTRLAMRTMRNGVR